MGRQDTGFFGETDGFRVSRLREGYCWRIHETRILASGATTINQRFRAVLGSSPTVSGGFVRQQCPKSGVGDGAGSVITTSFNLVGRGSSRDFTLYPPNEESRRENEKAAARALHI